VLEGQRLILRHIIDADAIAKNEYNSIKAGKQAVEEINYCLDNNLSFTQHKCIQARMDG